MNGEVMVDIADNVQVRVVKTTLSGRPVEDAGREAGQGLKGQCCKFRPGRRS